MNIADWRAAQPLNQADVLPLRDSEVCGLMVVLVSEAISPVTHAAYLGRWAASGF